MRDLQESTAFSDRIIHEIDTLKFRIQYQCLYCILDFDVISKVKYFFIIDLTDSCFLARPTRMGDGQPIVIQSTLTCRDGPKTPVDIGDRTAAAPAKSVVNFQQ